LPISGRFIKTVRAALAINLYCWSGRSGIHVQRADLQTHRSTLESRNARYHFQAIPDFK
jgi:hypothetical protein